MICIGAQAPCHVVRGDVPSAGAFGFGMSGIPRRMNDWIRRVL